MPLPFGILLLGFSLRLVALDLIQFDGDEAYILGLARAALDTRSLPLTSLPSSGGLSNPPLPRAFLHREDSATRRCRSGSPCSLRLYRLIRC